MAHRDQPARLNDLARLAHLSPFHFHRVFQAIVGETPADFSKRVRLDHALTLISRKGSRSLTQIALACGFTSSSDFSRAFKHRFGTPPRSFDLGAWRTTHRDALESLLPRTRRISRLPPRASTDDFAVTLESLPSRRVAYIRVDRPYQGRGVITACERLVAWASAHGFADGQWLGYQWENPEVTDLADCRYFVAVVLPAHHDDRSLAHLARGEVGLHRFPRITVAQITLDGTIDLELRALQWLYGSWLPRSRFVPDDHPCFESWIGLPFAHGTERFTLRIQLPVQPRRA